MTGMKHRLVAGVVLTALLVPTPTLSYALVGTTPTPTPTPTPSTVPVRIQYSPCRWTLSNVSVCYEKPSLVRRLTSSIPHRAWALSHLDWTAQSSDLVLLTGASSSGKSTLLQLLLHHHRHQQHQQQQQPPSKTSFPPQQRRYPFQSVTGCISLVSLQDEWSTSITSNLNINLNATETHVATPIYLHQTPLNDLSKEIDMLTVWKELWDQITTDTTQLKRRKSGWKFGTGSTTKGNNHDAAAFDIFQTVAHQLMQTVGLSSSDQTNETVTAKRTPCSSVSNMYRFELVKACLQSIFTSSPPQVCALLETTTTGLTQRVVTVIVPAPIIIIDEWLDKETSTVIQAVQVALWSLCREARPSKDSAVSATNRTTGGPGPGGPGALILCVTHYPERWNKQPAIATPQKDKDNDDKTNSGRTNAARFRHVTLSGGRILTDALF